MALNINKNAHKYIPANKVAIAIAKNFFYIKIFLFIGEIRRLSFRERPRVKITTN
jgi:hypothetical protein